MRGGFAWARQSRWPRLLICIWFLALLPKIFNPATPIMAPSHTTTFVALKRSHNLHRDSTLVYFTCLWCLPNSLCPTIDCFTSRSLCCLPTRASKTPVWLLSLDSDHDHCHSHPLLGLTALHHMTCSLYWGLSIWCLLPVLVAHYDASWNVLNLA